MTDVRLLVPLTLWIGTWIIAWHLERIARILEDLRADLSKLETKK
jgi:hypothetical protein